MAFKYINPGFNTGAFANMKTESNNNTAIYPAGLVLKGSATYNLPNVSKTVFVSFGNNKIDYGYQEIYGYNTANGKKTGVKLSNGKCEIYINNSLKETVAIVNQTTNNSYLSIKTGETDGEIHFYFNGEEVFAFTGDVMGGDEISYLAFQNNQSFVQSAIFNIIISDEYFPVTEKIIKLTAANTTATMTANSDGSFTATEAGQNVMQTIDTAALVKSIGSDNKITGVSLIGNPAYYDGEGLNHLTAMRGETTKDTFTLTTTTTNKILASWRENLTISDLASLSLGWKAAE